MTARRRLRVSRRRPSRRRPSRRRPSRRQPSRRQLTSAPANRHSKLDRRVVYSVLGTAAAASALFATYKYITREPGQDWFRDAIRKWQKRSNILTVWVPGVSTKEGYDAALMDSLKVRGLGSEKACPIAYFPYSSRVVSLDLLSALMDKLPLMDLRPQIKNLQLALSLFLGHFQHICIVCHSHGALLVRRTLEALHLNFSTRIRVNAFGPAVLVPQTSDIPGRRYITRYSRNWVNQDDVLVRLGVLKMPAGTRWDDAQQRIEQDRCVYYLMARRAPQVEDFRQWCGHTQLQPGGLGVDAHSCYPFDVGVFCRDRIDDGPVFYQAPSRALTMLDKEAHVDDEQSDARM